MKKQFDVKIIFNATVSPVQSKGIDKHTNTLLTKQILDKMAVVIKKSSFYACLDRSVHFYFNKDKCKFS